MTPLLDEIMVDHSGYILPFFELASPLPLLLSHHLATRRATAGYNGRQEPESQLRLPRR